MNAHAVLRIVTHEEAAAMLPLRDIYESSFPTDERRYFDSVIKLIRDDPDFRFCAIERSGKPVGLFSFWHLGHFVFVEHFAIAQPYRGWGIGQYILESWLPEQSLPVVLEAERPEDEMSRRRVAFYERAGFRHWPLDYLQPAYSVDKHPVPLHLMTYGDIDLDEMFDEVRRKLYQKVYATALPPI